MVPTSDPPQIFMVFMISNLAEVTHRGNHPDPTMSADG
jgi:hypothetical protein